MLNCPNTTLVEIFFPFYLESLYFFTQFFFAPTRIFDEIIPLNLLLKHLSICFHEICHFFLQCFRLGISQIVNKSIHNIFFPLLMICSIWIFCSVSQRVTLAAMTLLFVKFCSPSLFIQLSQN